MAFAGLSKDCDALPDLSNGKVACKTIGFRNVCSLTCDEGHEFLVKDNTIQRCIEGKWSYQQDEVSFPSCESTCPPGSTYNKTIQLCDPCQHGAFKSSSGLEGCTLCEEGLHARVRGASRCEGWSLATQVKEQDEIDDWTLSDDLPKAPESKFYRYKRSEPTPTPESPTVKGAWRVRLRHCGWPGYQIVPPPTINGGWGQFKIVGTCSTSCGGGTQRQDRLCNKPAPQRGGKACYGSSYQYADCNIQCCPLNGGWSGWENGSCSTTCGKGVLERRRRCNNPRRSCGGARCPGPSTTNVECQLRLCPDIDECSIDVHSCDPGTSTCVNTIGGFKCDCLPGYVKTGDECK